MFKRNLYGKMLEWKNSGKSKNALLIEGARRVGKSTLVKDFAKNEYESYLLIDFSEATKELKNLFLDYRKDLNTFFLYLQTYTGVTLIKKRSAIIFDEIQMFPPARELIKKLVADGRFDYIETGSLISIKQNVKDIIIPSEESTLKLPPLNFEEFLYAINQQSLVDAIKNSYKTKNPLPELIHKQAERFFREYILVGGMPQAVSCYIEYKDFKKADKVKRDILNLYANDIEKFGGTQALRIKRIFAGLPGQLIRHDKKYVLASLDKSARSREYADAFFWLSDSHISMTCLNVSDPSVGLAASAKENSFKCYMADTGLLISLLFADNESTPNELYKNILFDKLEINEGMFTENVIAQQLIANGHHLYFYSVRDRENSKNTMEIDFLITEGYDNAAGRMRVSPVEVKSTKRYSTVSLQKFKTKYKKRIGTQYVLHTKPLKVDGDVCYLPLYMSFCL